MSYSDYTTMLMHENRLRDAERRRAHAELLHEASEAAPGAARHGLLDRLQQWMPQRQPKLTTAEIRRAHAV